MKEKGGYTIACISAYIYVLEHIVSLCFRTARWMFRLFGKPGRGLDPEWGKNRSMRDPFSKGLLLQI